MILVLHDFLFWPIPRRFTQSGSPTPHSKCSTRLFPYLTYGASERLLRSHLDEVEQPRALPTRLF
jgi:hypothetical protein